MLRKKTWAIFLALEARGNERRTISARKRSREGAVKDRVRSIRDSGRIWGERCQIHREKSVVINGRAGCKTLTGDQPRSKGKLGTHLQKKDNTGKSRPRALRLNS